MFYESLLAKSTILYCCCMISASAGAFARPSLLFHADNCPHLNHRPTIGSNWHVALAVLGEIWECIRPRTGCPFHQLEGCLLVGRGRGEVYLTATLSFDQNDLWRSFFSSLLSSSLPASFSPLRYYCLWTASESLQSRTPARDWQAYSSSQWDTHIRGALTGLPMKMLHTALCCWLPNICTCWLSSLYERFSFFYHWI